MVSRHVACFLLYLLVNPSAASQNLLSQTQKAGQAAVTVDDRTVPFRLFRGHMILVEASAKAGVPLKLVIDTGARQSVLCKGIADRLQLTKTPQEVRLRAFGRVRKSRIVVLPGLRIGPVFASLPCLEAELPFPGIDGLIGLDLLERLGSILIDFREKTIRFGSAVVLESCAPVVRTSPVIVPVTITGRPLLLSVDTGSGYVQIDAGAIGEPVVGPEERDEVVIEHLGGESSSRWIILEEVRIGTGSWNEVKALEITGSSHPDCDGVLGVFSLGMSRLEIDFKRMLLSWSR